MYFMRNDWLRLSYFADVGQLENVFGHAQLRAYAEDK